MFELFKHVMRLPYNFKHPSTGFLLAGFLFFVLAGLWPARSCLGQEATITDFTVSNSENSLLLYFTVADWFTEDMGAAISNGIPVTFAFTVEIYEVRDRWPDKKILENEFNHVLEYDNLKKEYHIKRNEKKDTRVTTSLAEARVIMSEVNGFKVLPLAELNRGPTYTLRVKAKLARKTLPPSFHYLIPFSSPWDFETKWHELKLHLTL